MTRSPRRLALGLLGWLPLGLLGGCAGSVEPEMVQRTEPPALAQEAPATANASGTAGTAGTAGAVSEAIEYRFAEPISDDLVRLRVIRHAGRASPDVLRFPVPRPYLLVKLGARGEGMDLAVVYLPDSEEEVLVQPLGKRGRGDFAVVLGPGGFLERVSGQFRLSREHVDQAPIPAAPSPAAQPARLPGGDLGRMAGGLAPGLYRILLADPLGGPVPRLERVEAYPLARDEPPRIRAIAFRPCPERPELVRRIEVETDGASAPAIGALAGKVEVYRGGVPLADLERKIEGATIVLGADGDCTGAFASYRVSLPAAAAAAAAGGSVLEASFPSPEQLDLWRPSAEVHVVKDAEGAARYLVVAGDPGRGSPLQPPAREGPGAAQLLVNGKPARSTTVTRDVANANSFLLELAEPEPRSIHFEWTPKNAAGLAGKPVVFGFALPPEKKPDEVPVFVRDISLGPSAAGYLLALVLEAGAKRVDAVRTASGNRRTGWKEVSCSPPGGAKLTCTSLIDSTSNLHFDVYCEHDQDRPCLSVGMAR